MLFLYFDLEEIEKYSGVCFALFLYFYKNEDGRIRTLNLDRTHSREGNANNLAAVRGNTLLDVLDNLLKLRLSTPT